MRRTRFAIVATLLFALLLASCVQAAEQQMPDADAAGEVVPAGLELPAFQDFPPEAYPPAPKTSNGQVMPAKVETDLFHAKFEGDAVSGSGGPVGGKYHFIASQTDGEAWHVKLEANYPTIAGRDYFVTYRFHSDVAGTVKFGDFQEFQIHEGHNSVTGVFTAKESTSYLDLQLGMLPAFTIDFSEIQVKEYADEVDFENALPKPVDFEKESRVYEKHDQGYETILVRASHAINVNYDAIPTDPGVWKSRLYVKTGVVPKPGTHYRVTADVMSDHYERNIPFEVLLNDGDIEKGYGALYGQELVPGQVNVCEAVITGNGNGDELVLQFSLGEARSGALIIVGNVHVDEIKDHYKSVLRDGFALNGSGVTGKIIEEQVPVSYSDITPLGFSYEAIDTIYEQHDDGYVVRLMEGESSATLAIDQAPENPDDRGVWKVKLYAATGVSLDPNKSYRIQYDLESTGDQAEYEVCFDGDTENAYGALYGRSLTAGGTDHIDQLITPDANHGPLTVRIQLGKTDTAAGNTVTLKNFSVESVQVNYKNVLPDDFSYDTGTIKPKEEYESVLPDTFSYRTDVNVFERHADGYVQSVSAEDDTAKLVITEAPAEGRDVWNSQLLINTGVTPEAGKRYVVSFDVTGEKDQEKYEICFDGNQENFYGALYDRSMTAGVKQGINFSLVPEQSNGPIIIRLQLGATNDTTGNVVTVSNIKVRTVTATATSLGDIDYSTLANVWEENGDGFEQSVSSTDTSATLTITKARNDGEGGVWSSRLFVATGVTPEAGKRYRVSTTVASQKRIGDFEVVYDNGGTEDGYGFKRAGLSVGAGESNTVVTDITTPDSGCDELVLRFNLGNSPAGNTVTVSDIQICEISEGDLNEVDLTGFAYPVGDEGGTEKNSFDLEANEGAAAELTGDGSSATATVTKPGDDWHVKLYAKPGLEFEVGTTYTITMDVTGADGCTACFKNTAGEGEEGFGTATVSDGSVKHVVTPTEAGVMEVLLKIGNVPAGTEVTVSNLAIMSDSPTYEDVDLDGFAYPVTTPESTVDDDYFMVETNEGASAKLTGDGSSATATVIKHGDDWHIKFYVQPGVELLAGTTYTVSMDVEGADGRTAYFKNTSVEGEDGFGTEAISGGSVTHVVTPTQGGKLEVMLKLGDMNDGDEVTISNFAIKERKTDFIDMGFVPTYPDVTPESTVDDDYFMVETNEGASAKLTGDGSSATATVIKHGDDWHIKFYVQPGVELLAGTTYTVSMDVEGADGRTAYFKNTSVEGEDGFGTEAISGGSVTHVVTPTQGGKLEVMLKLGDMNDGDEVTISNFKLGILEADVTPAIKYWLEDPGTGAAATQNGNSVTVVTPTPADAWKIKFYIQPQEMALESGKQYRVDFDVQNSTGCEVCYKNLSVDSETGYGQAWVGDPDAEGWSTVSKTIQGSGGRLEVLLKLAALPAGTVVTVDNVHIYEVNSDPVSILPSEFVYPETTPEVVDGKSFMLEVNDSEGAAAKLSTTGSSAIATVINNAKDWHVKLYVMPGLNLEADKKYKITMDVSGADGRTVNFKNTGATQGDPEEGFGTEEISEGKVSHEFTAKESGELQIVLKLGDMAAGSEVEVTGVKVYEYTYGDADATPEGFIYPYTTPESTDNNSFKVEAYEGADAKLTGGENSAITTIITKGSDWHVKTFAMTGVELEAGKTYKISMNVAGAAGRTVYYRNETAEVEDGFGSETMSDGTVTHTVTPTTGGELVIVMLVGDVDADETVTVKDIAVSEYKPAGADVTPKDFAYPETTPNTLEKNSFDLEANSGAEAKLSGDGASATATVTKPGDDWHVKMYAKTGLTLEAGKTYKISMDVNGAAGRTACYKNATTDAEEGFGTETISDGTVSHTVKVAEDGELEILLKIGDVAADTKVKVSNVKVEEVTEVVGDNLMTDALRAWAPVNFWAHEDYEATLADDGSSAKLSVHKAPALGREPWKIKLFVETGMTLKAGKTYRISANVRSAKPLNYEICYNDGANEAALGAKYELAANSKYKTVTYETTPENDASLILQFNLGNAAKGNGVRVTNVTVEELSETLGDNLMTDALVAWAPVHQWLDGGYEAELTNDDSSATMTFSAVADEQADWKAKLFVETGAELTAGKRYHISYDIQADSGFDYNVFYNNGAEEKAVGEYYGLVAGSSQTVEHTVTPANDAVLTIQLMLGMSTAPNNVKISNVQVDEIVSPAPGRVPINFWAHEDYEAYLSNTDTSASIHITKVPAEGREAWKVKLFAETGAELEAGKAYRVSVDVKATDTLYYDICYNNGGEEAALGGKYGLEGSTSNSTVTYNVAPEQDSTLTLQLNLGNATGPNTVAISNVKVEEIEYASATNVIPGFRFDSVGYFSKASDEGYVTSLDREADSATFRILRAPEERHAWSAKVIVRTGITPASGMGYRVTFFVDALKPQNLFEVFFDGTDELAYGALYEQRLNAGRNEVSYTIMPGDSKGDLTMQLRFGETDGTDGNTYVISGFRFEEVTFVTQQRPEVKDVVENDTQDGYSALLTKTRDKATLQLVSTPSEGLEAWKNKLFVYTGVTLKPDQKYRVSMNVKSIIPAPFEVCFNKGDEEKGLGGVFGLTSQPAGYFLEYTTYVKEDIPLVLQLSLGNCTAPNTIFLSDVKVEEAGKINLASDTIYTF